MPARGRQLAERPPAPAWIGGLVAAVSAALATGRSLPWMCAAALIAGIGSAVSGTLYATTTQRQVPPGALARVTAYNYFGAFALGPVGLAAAGPVSVLIGTSGVLGFGAVWQVTTVAAVLALPAIHAKLPQQHGDGALGM